MVTNISHKKPLPNWEELLQISQKNTTAKWILRTNKSPSTTTISSYLEGLKPGEKPPVLFYRDTHGWCPFCERVWLVLEEKQIPFEVELINLKDKPQWYKDMVPTGLVPAVKIAEELVYESKDILLTLEQKFESFPLLPKEPQEKSIALEMIENFDSNGLIKAGYYFISNSRFNSQQNTEITPEEKEVQLLNLQTTFEAKLDECEEILGKYPGVYFMPEFSLVDIMYTPGLRRLSANLPVFRGYSIYNNVRFPRINQWLMAIDQRQAYQRIKPNTQTNNLVMESVFGLQPIYDSKLAPKIDINQEKDYRMEAAGRLSSNYQTVVADIVKNSGIKAWVNQENLPTIESVIDLYLRRLVYYLIEGSIPLFSDSSVNAKTEPQNEFKEKTNADAAVGAIALAFLRNRVCVPRDMSANSAVALQTAIDTMLSCIY
ncbi:glutathione S-transferase family protein [Okeania sp.]|uniref:glutathione S-transferase family protein n=1 Tax=Okeania sp. TaxID=3100323 RepID=UPI002B4B8DDA|nr:glutathione S-transferase family protein [Okeania sp.]MEB3342745.1 glutathione S-transferase family protein [Okeania sp.]